VLSLSARKIPGDADRSDLLLLALVDVTARANITAGLLANSERKDQFLAMLGHELRHPLTPITHAIYLLRQGGSDANRAELLETIDTETQRLLRFVNELLDVARIDRGLIEIRQERLDFVAVAREAVQALLSFIEQRGHKLSLVLPADPIYVVGDSGRLNQVITNLVENAAKFTEPGGQITVTLEQRGAEAVLRVRDSGIGIAPEDLERVFEPFQQSQGAFGRASRGLGLGLSVARHILELHRGRIEVTSGGLLMGSEFVATLPMLTPAKRDGWAPDSPMKSPAPLVMPQTRRVMIVDDHPEVSNSLARLVRGWGHEVAIAADGPSALSLAQRFQPECAVIDLSMPGMNGMELAQRLRKIFPPARLYMIALTGYAGASIRDACLAAGFDVHVVKPGEIALLERLLGADGADRDLTSH
jgi:CheY-like chemotaxis protein/nitrogen-specific signal transduction histidine kinase